MALTQQGGTVSTTPATTTTSGSTAPAAFNSTSTTASPTTTSTAASKEYRQIRIYTCICNPTTGTCVNKGTDTWPNQILNVCFQSYDSSMTVVGIDSLDATRYNQNGCPYEWNCGKGRCYRTSNGDQRCVSVLNGRGPFDNSCYSDSTDCVSLLFRANAIVLAPFVIDGQNMRGTTTARDQPSNGAYALSIRVPETVVAGDFFFVQGAVALSGAKDVDVVYSKVAMRVRLRRPVSSTKPPPTPAPKPIAVDDKPYFTPTKKTNSGLTWPQSLVLWGISLVCSLWSF